MKAYHHERYGVSATADLWKACGYSVYSDGTTGGCGHYGIEELIGLGIVNAGMENNKAVAWALQEKQRRYEESCKTSAANREAEAISQLAATIRGTDEQTVLHRLLGRLTEKTQYAVRAQLKGG